jgi:hypothetical protein
VVNHWIFVCQSLARTTNGWLHVAGGRHLRSRHRAQTTVPRVIAVLQQAHLSFIEWSAVLRKPTHIFFMQARIYLAVDVPIT